MIVGLGIDWVEISRFSAAVARHGERFYSRVFTKSERADCRDRADAIQALAARFAAKEATMKALGTGWSDGVGFRHIEVVRHANGAPELKLHEGAAAAAERIGASRFHLSLTHQPSAAGAVVVLERD